MEAPYRFRVIDAYNYTYDTPEPWQAWHEAYFRRISSVLGANGEPVRLKDDGCTMPEYTTPNCTRTCSNATSMFYSESNVWNCIALATVSIQVLQGNKSFDEENVALMDQRFNLGGSDLRAIDQLGIFAQFKPYRSRPINASNIREFANITNGPYCQSTSLGIDSDIAGPGIIVSYMMLLSLVLLLSVLFCLFGLYGIKAREETTEPSDSSQKPRKKVQSLIINLQEAQGSFVFTVSLVYLIAFDGNTVGLSNIGTLLSYVINRNIGYGLMIIGTFSVAFLHYFACKSDNLEDAESFLMSLCEILLCVVCIIPYDDLGRDRIVSILGILRLRAKTTVDLWEKERRLWRETSRCSLLPYVKPGLVRYSEFSNLFYYAAHITKLTNGLTDPMQGSRKDAANIEDASAWVSLNAFAGRITKKGLVECSLYAIIEIPKALEKEIPPSVPT
ncbi:hypothetical protein FPRO06_13759 [Fusarium proliferatum]|nr:hypothetical protein FPRO06_13759 [Fusarium proliferatum]